MLGVRKDDPRKAPAMPVVAGQAACFPARTKVAGYLRIAVHPRRTRNSDRQGRVVLESGTVANKTLEATLDSAPQGQRSRGPQTDAIVGAPTEVHRDLGRGFLEAVCQEAAQSRTITPPFVAA